MEIGRMESLYCIDFEAARAAEKHLWSSTQIPGV